MAAIPPLNLQSYVDGLEGLSKSHLLPDGWRGGPLPPGQPEPHTTDHWCVGPYDDVVTKLNVAWQDLRQLGYNILYSGTYPVRGSTQYLGWLQVVKPYDESTALMHALYRIPSRRAP